MGNTFGGLKTGGSKVHGTHGRRGARGVPVRQIREGLEVKLEESIDPDNIVAIMLKRNTNWDDVKGFIRKVQSRREEYERLRQKGNH